MKDKWSKDHPRSRELALWLARVKEIYSLAGKPPPPILLVFLFEKNIAKERKLKRIRKDPDYFHGMVEEALPYVEEYRDQGWNLEMISLGTTIDATKYAENPSLLVVDEKHPNCRTNELLAEAGPGLLWLIDEALPSHCFT